MRRFASARLFMKAYLRVSVYGFWILNWRQRSDLFNFALNPLWINCKLARRRSSSGENLNWIKQKMCLELETRSSSLSREAGERENAIHHGLHLTPARTDKSKSCVRRRRRSWRNFAAMPNGISPKSVVQKLSKVRECSISLKNM